MSRDGLEALYNEILDEQESFELLQRRSAEMSSALAAAFEEAWVLALIEEQEVVQRLIVERGRPRPPHLEPHEFETWAPSP